MYVPNNQLSVDSASAVTSIGDISRYCPHKPSERQREFLRLTCRHGMYGGRAGCGKSDVAVMNALQGIMVPDYAAILFRRTYKDLTLSGALLDRMRSWFPSEYWNRDAMRFDFPIGSSIGVGYLDCDKDVERYESAQYQFIGFDEATQFTGYQMGRLNARLRRLKGSDFPVRMRLYTNPGGPGHEYICKRYGITPDMRFPEGAQPIVTRSKSGDPRVFFPAHPKDNPGLDWEDYQKSLDELPEVRRQQMQDGIWIQDTNGMWYPAISKARRVAALPRNLDLHFGLSLDVGATNNCAIAVLAWCDYTNEIYIARTEEPSGLNTPREVGSYLKTLDNRLHFEWMVGDHGGLGKGYLNECRKWFKLPIMNVDKNDKAGYMQLLNGALSDGTVVLVDGECDTFETEASALLKDKTGLKELEGMRNHSCDAVLYGFRRVGHYQATAVTPDPKNQMDEQEKRAVLDYQSRYDFDNGFGFEMPTL